MDLFADLPPPGKNCYIIYHGDNKGENYCILQRSYRAIDTSVISPGRSLLLLKCFKFIPKFKHPANHRQHTKLRMSELN